MANKPIDIVKQEMFKGSKNDAIYKKLRARKIYLSINEILQNSILNTEYTPDIDKDTMSKLVKICIGGLPKNGANDIFESIMDTNKPSSVINTLTIMAGVNLLISKLNKLESLSPEKRKIGDSFFIFDDSIIHNDIQTYLGYNEGEFVFDKLDKGGETYTIYVDPYNARGGTPGYSAKKAVIELGNPEFFSKLLKRDPVSMFKIMGANQISEFIRDWYGGFLHIEGHSKIKPYDDIFLYDTSRDMYGLFEVKEIVHTYDSQGYITTITPSVNTKVTYDIGSAGLFGAVTAFDYITNAAVILGATIGSVVISKHLKLYNALRILKSNKNSNAIMKTITNTLRAASDFMKPKAALAATSWVSTHIINTKLIRFIHKKILVKIVDGTYGILNGELFVNKKLDTVKIVNGLISTLPTPHTAEDILAIVTHHIELQSLEKLVDTNEVLIGLCRKGKNNIGAVLSLKKEPTDVADEVLDYLSRLSDRNHSIMYEFDIEEYIRTIAKMKINGKTDDLLKNEKRLRQLLKTDAHEYDVNYIIDKYKSILGNTSFDEKLITSGEVKTLVDDAISRQLRTMIDTLIDFSLGNINEANAENRLALLQMTLQKYSKSILTLGNAAIDSKSSKFIEASGNRFLRRFVTQKEFFETLAIAGLADQVGDILRDINIDLGEGSTTNLVTASFLQLKGEPFVSNLEMFTREHALNNKDITQDWLDYFAERFFNFSPIISSVSEYINEELSAAQVSYWDMLGDTSISEQYLVSSRSSSYDNYSGSGSDNYSESGSDNFIGIKQEMLTDNILGMNAGWACHYASYMSVLGATPQEAEKNIIKAINSGAMSKEFVVSKPNTLAEIMGKAVEIATASPVGVSTIKNLVNQYDICIIFQDGHMVIGRKRSLRTQGNSEYIEVFDPSMQKDTVAYIDLTSLRNEKIWAVNKDYKPVYSHITNNGYRYITGIRYYKSKR